MYIPQLTGKQIDFYMEFLESSSLNSWNGQLSQTDKLAIFRSANEWNINVKEYHGLKDKTPVWLTNLQDNQELQCELQIRIVIRYVCVWVQWV